MEYTRIPRLDVLFTFCHFITFEVQTNCTCTGPLELTRNCQALMIYICSIVIITEYLNALTGDQRKRIRVWQLQVPKGHVQREVALSNVKGMLNCRIIIHNPGRTPGTLDKVKQSKLNYN